MCKSFCIALTSVAALAGLGTTLAFTQQSKDTLKQTTKETVKQATQKAKDAAPEMPAVPGMSAEDMQACMEASIPGAMQARLCEDVGEWTGKHTMWMSPEAPPSTTDAKYTISSMLDGRFVRCDMSSEMPGAGPFHGFGLTGFDNVSQKFQSTWVDSYGTGMMWGTGTLSADGKTLTFEYTYNCPINKKPMTMRQVERRTGTDTRTMEMWAPAPETGKPYKMLEGTYTRKAAPTKVGKAESAE
ncbi:MAG: DUF1579 domain-containing protein [Phycisphaerae bacterium]|nr:DUF1579 domain-containing protein [Phycisphaerae bacterium]